MSQVNQSTPPTSSNPPSPTTLMTLPPEVRLHILGFVIDSVQVIEVSDQQLYPSSNANITDTSMLPYMGANCTSKQLHAEVQEILARKGEYITVSGTEQECWRFAMNGKPSGPSFKKFEMS